MASECSFPHAGAHCDKGLCTLGACAMGFFNCNALAQDGCETDILNDPLNCGKCIKPCGGDTADCKDGHCK